MSIKGFRNYLISEAAMTALLERAENTGVSVEVLHEVFDRGVVAWDESTNKTPTQYAFNRVDSFINGGFAYQLDEDLLDELSKGTLLNYKRKAQIVVDNTPEDDKSHKKSKKGIERADKKLNEEKTRHPEHKKAYVEPYQQDGESAYKASDKNGHVKFFNKHGRKSAFKHAGLNNGPKEVKEEQIDEISMTTKAGYIKKATKSVDDLHNGEYTNEKDNKAFKRKLYIALAKKTKSESNVVDTSGTELIERKVLARDDPAQYASVHRRDTKSSNVRQRHTEKEKDMHDRHRTEVVLRVGFQKRNNKDTHLVDKKGHQLTDRLRDQNRERLSKLRKAKNVQEGAEYIEARRKLHDAHHESARLHAGMERDPELRRQDLHRAKRHKHASRVLEIIQSKRKKKDKK